MKRRAIRGHGKIHVNLGMRLSKVVYWGKFSHQHEEWNRISSRREGLTLSPAMQAGHTWSQAAPSTNATWSTHTDFSGAEDKIARISEHSSILLVGAFPPVPTGVRQSMENGLNSAAPATEE